MSIESIMNVYTNLPARDRSVTEIREELIFGVCVWEVGTKTFSDTQKRCIWSGDRSFTLVNFLR